MESPTSLKALEASAMVRKPQQLLDFVKSATQKN